MGHALVLQDRDSVVGLGHDPPCFAGVVVVQFRVCVPPPHDLSHALQPLHEPTHATGEGGGGVGGVGGVLGGVEGGGVLEGVVGPVDLCDGAKGIVGAKDRHDVSSSSSPFIMKKAAPPADDDIINKATTPSMATWDILLYV
jgi:hypothetical protein